ncbi:MAG: glycerol-3-phosphate 1-O-acyltransferase PlsY [Alphaproteobacteria bacterium]
MPAANELVVWWGAVAAVLGAPDWKLIVYGWTIFLPATLAAYLLGAVPFGLLLTRVAGLGDVRRIGSGNIGATNVLRTGRKDLAAATLLLDGAKGAAAVLAAGWWLGPDARWMCGLAAVLGHLYPVWLGFRGGKGVATTLGTLLAFAWPVGAAACALWLATAALLRFSSLAALVATAGAPVAGWLLGEPQAAGLALVLAPLVWFKHRANIARLLAGSEPRIGAKKAADRPTGD